MKLRHKPTVVDGVDWDDTPEARSQLAALGFEFGVDGYLSDAPAGAPRILHVRTTEGDRPALPGEYTIIRGTQGEWYCISHTVKAACYEAGV